MKHCPRCGATGTNEDAFCESDGAKLVDDEDEASLAVTAEIASVSVDEIERAAARANVRPGARAVPMIPCPSCGEANPEDGDGYCVSCGHRLSGDRSTPPLVPVGASVGGGEVIAARSADDFVVRMPTGELVTLAVGSEQGLSLEMAALAALEGDARFPRVIEHGDDTRHGAFLALTPAPEGARRLIDEARAASAERALAILEDVIGVARAVEKAGFDWLPDKNDLWLDAKDGVVASRVRVAERLAPGARLDARSLLEALGSTFVPEPAIKLTPSFIRLVVSHHAIDFDAHFDLDQAKAALDAVRAELPLPPEDAPDVAALCDAGLRRDHNEDAVAVASGVVNGERWTALVVCDGVSASAHAEQASSIASKTACDVLAHFARSGDLAFEAATSAMATAIRAAHLAVCSTKIEHATDEPPGTTIVAGFVFKRRLTVGWVGDSRAYWVSATGAELLTRDHSWANEAVARGEVTEEEAMRAPLAHALTKCLGPLEVGDEPLEIDPDVRARDLPGAGTIILCSDGLWNYFPTASAVAELVHSAGKDASPPAIARWLVNQALARGGQDNVTVAVHRHS